MEFFDTNLEVFGCDLLMIKEVKKDIIFRKAVRLRTAKKEKLNRIESAKR